MTGRDTPTDRETEISVDGTLSEESRRQRDGGDNIGAFGMRTGESDLVFFQGILPEINGDVKGSAPIDEQIEMCLDRLELMLENCNASLDSVMKVEIQLADTDRAEAVDRAYESRFDDVAFPPRTVVGVCSLPGGADVQLDVIAAEE
ncbi:2-iminobutanoate/2-iminopropanoate deaminase [Halorubrum alkaliphilum]|uniref:2-iminobutanoate/2-iminopropanoate deaminase n=1 Tax=Halorubrum alkaliphilum TaxID=261290 RepID=A0A8T4GGZ9_9EURY|nr:2-iminobutanoate/2-iminopropanoate deaminase [Halorubrum alkaliphilum]